MTNNKIFIMNETRFAQIEIEVQQMNEDKTVIFLVPEEKESKFISFLEDLLLKYHYTTKEVMEVVKENNISVFYMCTMFDDRIEHEV